MLLPLRRSKVSVVAVYPAVGHERIVVGEGVVAGVLLRSVGQLVDVQPRVAHLLYPRGPWDPERLVPPQRSGWSGRVLGQAAGEHSRVLDRLSRALREEREHRVRSVAEQGDRAVGPATQWRPVQQCRAFRLIESARMGLTASRMRQDYLRLPLWRAGFVRWRSRRRRTQVGEDCRSSSVGCHRGSGCAGCGLLWLSTPTERDGCVVHGGGA